MGKMRKLWWFGIFFLIVLSWLFSTSSSYAQTPVPSPVPSTTKIAWQHDGLRVESWKLRVDSVESTISVTHEPDTSWTTPFPAMTPGNHTIEVAACNIAGCSWSDPLGVVLVVIPNKPLQLTVIQ